MQARMMGLYTHGMAGFDREGIFDKLGILRDKYTAIAAFAMGKYGYREKLDDDFKEIESPSGRKPLTEIIVKGKMRSSD